MKILIMSLFFLAPNLIFAHAKLDCDYTFDETRNSPEPNNNFMVVRLRDEDGKPIRFVQVLPMSLQVREQLALAVEGKHGVCFKATFYDRLYYVHEVTLL
jgi:hypothetical protein